jgi:hypothetical protein
MLVLTLSAAQASAAEKPGAVLYKNPQCTCCEAYADYLRQNGYTVAVRPTHDLSLIKKRLGVPTELAGCHTTLIGRYVVEGHVPVGTIDRLLAEQPNLRGISLPGMPTGSPGMSGPKTEPFKIYGFGEGTQKVYAVE